MIRKPMISAMRFLADNPYVNLLAGGILIATALHEIINSSEDAGVGAHHGVLAFGIVHALSAVPEILHGFDQVLKADEATSSDPEPEPDPAE